MKVCSRKWKYVPANKSMLPQMKERHRLSCLLWKTSQGDGGDGGPVDVDLIVEKQPRAINVVEIYTWS